ncbi:MAG: methyltransferase domain-containing protein, partial [Verrucomicrobiota bacterium]
MNIETVKGYFDDPRTVDHYMKAVANVGLWESEEAVFCEYFDESDRILDLGCGAGRIALGLNRLGYERIVGADLSLKMVERAQEVAG